MKNIYIYLIIALIFLGLGGFIGIKFFSTEKEEKESVNSRMVLDKISDESFLVTKSVVINEETTKKTENQSWWSKLWFQDEVLARALVTADIGIDLSKIEENDITIDKTEKKISVNLPSAEIRNVSIKGDIELLTTDGLIVKFTRNKDDDYNNAMERLKTEATEGLETEDDLKTEARESALNILKVMLKDTDYTVVMKD